MADYFLDDAANGTNDGASWETCYNTWAQVNTAAILTSANRLIVGADANITDPGAALTITGPTSGLPTTIISSTVGTGTAVAYSVGTGKQVDTDSGAYDIIFDGSFAVYGLKVVSGGHVNLTPDANEFGLYDKCTFVLGAGKTVTYGSDQCRIVLQNCIVDLTADGTSARTAPVMSGAAAGVTEIRGLTFVNAAYRTATVFGVFSSRNELISGVDFSGFTNATTCELASIADSPGRHAISNCLTAATWTPTTGTPRTGIECTFSNCGPADAPTYLYATDYTGTLISTPSIYRTGGAAVEGDACSWLITTTANCGEGAPFYTPWIYGTVSSTGSKTFTCYITNDTADFTDAEVWLEVEYLSTSDEAIWALATDQRATITTTAAAQTDDTTSSWNGTGPSFTYKQSLAVTATVNETGQFRARVAVGVASIAGSRYFYVDPKVTVT